ncbi:unnamed protein product [Vicia faba]|uniref:Uncharacterized protein n=1 Tax=Vicia faba TaxID=3906 RepID=A0AAV0YDG8_VICFA|nr:unnamed protein product [Vicia faba]
MGCIFAHIIKRRPLFNDIDTHRVLAEIFCLFGMPIEETWLCDLAEEFPTLGPAGLHLLSLIWFHSLSSVVTGILVVVVIRTDMHFSTVANVLPQHKCPHAGKTTMYLFTISVQSVHPLCSGKTVVIGASLEVDPYAPEEDEDNDVEDGDEDQDEAELL